MDVEDCSVSNGIGPHPPAVNDPLDHTAVAPRNPRTEAIPRPLAEKVTNSGTACDWNHAGRDPPGATPTKQRQDESARREFKPMTAMKTLAILTSLALLFPAAASAMIFVKIPGMGDSSITVPGYDDGQWFIADSFSFGIEREMAESGEKGGTEDINIGVGELQECTISKSMDRASAHLAQFAINGNSCDTAEIHFVEVAGGGDDGTAAQPFCYLKYKLDRCFVKSWSTSGDADDRPTEEVAFYYNKIAFGYGSTAGPGGPGGSSWMSWDNVKQTPWTDHGLSLD